MKLREIAWRVVATLRRRSLDRETRAELRFHLDMEVEAGMARGLSREEAERTARLRAGTIPSAIEAVRDERGLGPLDGALTDVRHAWSSLARQPGFAASVGAALALAVAMNTLIVAVADGVLLRPLPYPEPGRLVRVFEWSKRNPKWPVSVGNFQGLERANRSLARIALYTREDAQLMHGSRPERLPSVRITDGFFPTLGVHPALGRNFSAEDLRRSARVVILSDRLWVTTFQRDTAIVGKTIRLDRESWTVVGVMPPGVQHVGGSYRSPLQGETVALWRPLAVDLPENGLRNWHFCNALARLDEGVSVAQASEDLNRVMDDLVKQYPQANEGVRVEVVPLADAVTSSSRATVRLLLAAGALVLLIATVNVAGLCVARVLSRRRELAIRQALGARSWRIVRAVLAENLIVGIVGGLVGLGLGAGLLPLLRSMMPAEFPRLHEVRLSGVTIAFALGSALLASIVAGLVPALRQARQDAREGLSEDNRIASSARGTRRLRAGLVVAEVSLACLLCIGTTLLMRSAMSLDARDHGFDARGVLSFSLSLPAVTYDKPETAARLFGELTRALERLPGVRAAGVASNLPWTGYDENTSFDLVGRPAPPGDPPQARFQTASPGFFHAMRMRLVAGRLIDERDGPKAPLVVVVNEGLARRYFPAGDAVGQRVDIWGDKRQVVGIVADVRDRPADAGAEPAFWWPVDQQPFTSMRVVLKADGDPIALAGPAAAVVRRLDPELPVAEIRTVEEIANEAVAERRLALWLFQAFTLLALALAGVAIYAMLAYDVQQRRRELGVRMAMGASRSGIARLVVGHAAWLSALGILMAVVTAPAVMRLLGALLFGVTPTDPASLMLAPLFLLSVALVAGAIPAWAASRAGVVSALREQ